MLLFIFSLNWNRLQVARWVLSFAGMQWPVFLRHVHFVYKTFHLVTVAVYSFPDIP